MKKLIMLFLGFFLLATLSSCVTDKKDDSLFYEEEEVIDPALELSEHFDNYNDKFNNINATIIYNNTHLYVYDEDDNIIGHQQYSYSYKYDEVIDYFSFIIRLNNENSTIHSIIDGRSGELREFSIIDQNVEVVGIYPDVTFKDYMESYEFDFELSINGLTNITKVNNVIYTAMISKEYFENFGIDDLFSEDMGISTPDSIQLRIVIDPDLDRDIKISYEINNAEIEIDGVVYNLTIKVESLFTVQNVTNIEDIFAVPYRFYLPSTKENIIENNHYGDYLIHAYIHSDQPGWTSVYLRPGTYLTDINKYDFYTAYDEDGNEIVLDDQLIIYDSTTIYFKFLDTDYYSINFYLDKQD